MSKERLDLAMVRRNLAESREKAQARIMAGDVFVKNQRADKASLLVGEEDPIELRGSAAFVSRGGHKLSKAMESFHVSAADVVAMDVGAATGGFTDVLLQAGARQVYAIDVGYGQLDWRLRQDPRVTVMERTNARYLTVENFEERPQLCVMDVSFISVERILPAIFEILGPEQGRVVSLVKPQFEAGRENVGKKGVVRQPKVHEDVLRRIRDFVESQDWCMEAVAFSPITGPEGNIEFLMDLRAACHGGQRVSDETIFETVRLAHQCLAKPGSHE